MLDAARQMLVVDVEGGEEVARREEPFGDADPARRALGVSRLGIDVLICGAVSRPLEAMLAAAGVRLIPQTCGPVEEILRAFRMGELTEQAFLMPGCRGRRRFRRGRGGHGRQMRGHAQ